jgi:acetylornithine deacetylase
MTPDARGLLQSINAAWCLDFLSQLVRFRSVGGAPGEADLARFLVDRMRGLGLEADLQPVEGERCNAIGTWRGGGGGVGSS